MARLGLFGSAAPRLQQRLRDYRASQDQAAAPAAIMPADVGAVSQPQVPSHGMMMKGPPKPKADKGFDWFGLAGLAGATLNEMGGNLGSVANFTDRRTKRADQDALNEAFAGMNLTPEEAIYARSDPNGFLAARFEQANTLKKPQTETFWDPAINDWRKKPSGPIAVADGTDLVDPETKQPIYSNAPKPPTPSLPPGWQMGTNGPEAIPGYAEWYRKLHPLPAKTGSGNAPPSGYRWKQDGTLERIPGGPADKPATPAYDAPTARKFLNQAQTLDSLDGAINQYMGLIKKHGPQIQTTGIGGDNTVAAQLDAARTAIDIQTKELFNLGVLNGPDLDIIRGAIPDVTGWEAWGKTGDSVSASMNVLRDYISRGRSQIPPEIVSRARPNATPAAKLGLGAATAGASMPGLRGQIMNVGQQDDQVQDDDMDGFVDGLMPVDAADDASPPPGVTPEEWAAMPPEDRALFQ